MTQKTSIDWCVDPRTGERGHSWNPVRGCSRVSPGCQNCYAERIAGRFSGDHGDPYMPTTEKQPFYGFADKSGWTGRVEIIEDKLGEPLRRRKRTLYFCNSMSDLFHEKLSDEDIDKVFAVIALCPQHLFLVLTKRAKRMHDYFDDEPAELKYRWGAAAGELLDGDWIWNAGKTYRKRIERFISLTLGCDPDSDEMLEDEGTWVPLANVWLGVSVEDNAHRDRLDWLLKTPTALRFVSPEPMLSEVDIKPWLPKCPTPCTYCTDPHFGHAKPHVKGGLDWVICGGESGPGARPMELDWARQVRDDCLQAGVPFFLKSLGEWTEDVGGFSDEQLMAKDRTGGVLWDHRIPQMVRVGRKAAGRLLDGREWSQMPEVA